MNHTPGPWAVEPAGDGEQHPLVVDEQGVTVARCYQQPFDTWSAADNAHLLAAAPDLLAALQGCLAALNVAIERSEGDTFGIGHNDAMDAMDAAERGIAKAKGAA